MDSEAEASIFEFDDDLQKQVPECSLTAVCPCAVSLPLVPPAEKNLRGKICVFWWSLFRSNYLALKKSRHSSSVVSIIMF